MQLDFHSDIAAAFDRAIRYAADRADGIHGSSRSAEPLGFDVPGTDIHAQLPRAAAADYLRELGRDDEADAAQFHEGPLLLHGGKVKKGRYGGYDELLRRVEAVHNHLDDISGGQWTPDYDFTVHRGDLPEGVSRSRIPPDHFRVWSTHDDFDPGSDSHEDVHVSDLGRNIADRIEDSYNHGDYGWNTDGIEDFSLDGQSGETADQLRRALMQYHRANGRRSIEEIDHREATGRLLHGHEHSVHDLRGLQGALAQYADSHAKRGEEDAAYWANVANFTLHPIIAEMEQNQTDRLDELDRRLQALRDSPVVEPAE